MPILSKRFQNVASIPFRRDEVSGVPARISSNGRPSPASTCASLKEILSDFRIAIQSMRIVDQQRQAAFGTSFLQDGSEQFCQGRLLRQADSRSEQIYACRIQVACEGREPPLVRERICEVRV